MPQCQVKFNVLYNTDVQENGFILRFVCLILLLLIVLKRNKIMLKEHLKATTALRHWIILLDASMSKSQQLTEKSIIFCCYVRTHLLWTHVATVLKLCIAQHTLMPICNYFMFFIWYYSLVFRQSAHDPLRVHFRSGASCF